jgi:integrase
MAVRMAKLRHDPKSGSWLSRKEVPRDIRDAYATTYGKRYEEIFRAPADCPAGRARVLFSEWQSEIDSRFAALRAKQLGQGHDLTQRQLFALAGEWYRWFTAQHGESPGHPDQWRSLYKAWDASLFQSEALDDETRTIDLDALGPQREALATAARATEFLIGKGERLSPSATTMFLDRVLWTYPKAVELLERRAKGDYSPDTHLETLPEYRPQKPSTPNGSSDRDQRSLGSKGAVAVPRPKAEPSTTALALFETYITEAKLAPETILRRRGVFTELDTLLAGRPFGALEPDEAQEWITSRVTDKRSAETVQKIYIASLKALGRWAVRHKHIASNPFEQVTIVVPRKTLNRETRAFTADEVQGVLGAASKITTEATLKITAQAARRWVPFICAYTGARAGEITQLRGKDIIERDGIWALRLTPEAGSIKTKQARIVPIHEHLIEQGLLEFKKARGIGPLFYAPSEPRGPTDPLDLKPEAEGLRLRRSRPVGELRRARSVNVRSNLARWIRSIGITDPEVSPTHGWRHTFKQIADRCGITERVSDTITGHVPQSEGRKYGQPTLEDMAEALKRFPRYKVSD